MIELKAKKRTVTLMKAFVQVPSWPVSVCWMSSMPVLPESAQPGVSSTSMAEAVHTTSVSK